MQALVYLFIGVAGASLAAAAYFGFTFSPIEATLAGLIVCVAALVLVERTLRRRSEARYEKAIDDLSRLLSADAQAGQVLSKRINALTEIDPGARLEAIEADMSVLGTVVRQVAEAVSELESTSEATQRQAAQPRKEEPEAPKEFEPVIPLEMLRQAIDDDRLVFHMQPIITLPQRQTHGYDILPRLMMEDGELADAADFMPRRGGDDMVRLIERRVLEQAVRVVRRARASGRPATLFIPVSHATLSDRRSSEELVGLLDANRVIAQSLVLNIPETAWRELTAAEKSVAAEVHGKGVSFSLLDAGSLRLDFGELAALGVTSLRVEAGRFINQPEKLTDFHTSDVAGYLARFGIDLLVDRIMSEQQVLTVLEDGIRLAQGPHIARPSPIRPELMALPDTPASVGQRLAGG